MGGQLGGQFSPASDLLASAQIVSITPRYRCSPNTQEGPLGTKRGQCMMSESPRPRAQRCRSRCSGPRRSDSNPPPHVIEIEIGPTRGGLWRYSEYGQYGERLFHTIKRLSIRPSNDQAMRTSQGESRRVWRAATIHAANSGVDVPTAATVNPAPPTNTWPPTTSSRKPGMAEIHTKDVRPRPHGGFTVLLHESRDLGERR